MEENCVSFDPGVFDPQVFGAAEVESCLFDGAVFDSAVFDVCVDAEPEPQPEPEQQAQRGGWIQRRRYILPNDALVWATPDEIQAILDEFVVVEQPKPKTKKQKRKAKYEPFVPLEIHFEPMLDFQVQTLRPVLPPVMVWRPDLEALQRRLQQLKRRIDDEEAILLLL